MSIKLLLVFNYIDWFFKKHGDLIAKAEYQRQDDIEKEEHEKFSIVKAYTVRNPRTVVVHIEHTSLASWTVMTPKLNRIYLYGLKLWHSKQYLLFFVSFYSAKNPQ